MGWTSAPACPLSWGFVSKLNKSCTATVTTGQDSKDRESYLAPSDMTITSAFAAP